MKVDTLRCMRSMTRSRGHPFLFPTTINLLKTLEEDNICIENSQSSKSDWKSPERFDQRDCFSWEAEELQWSCESIWVWTEGDWGQPLDVCSHGKGRHGSIPGKMDKTIAHWASTGGQVAYFK